MNQEDRPAPEVIEAPPEADAEERRPRLMGISLLPAAATLGNLLCGFGAVFFCLLSVRAEFAQAFEVQPRVFHPRLEGLFPTHIAAGAYLIVLAMIFDALDGRLARITRRTSEFGAQLDSIADIVSFGLAPAALFITVLMRPALDTPADIPDVSRLQFRLGMACAIVFVACAAIRLARYNAENVKSESAQFAFSGLPTPAAAALVIALLAFHEHVRSLEIQTAIDWTGASRWVIAAAILGAGLLMVSRLPYPHVMNAYVRRQQPPTHLVWLVAIIAAAWYFFELLLVLAAVAYVVSGPVAKWRRRGEPAEQAA